METLLSHYKYMGNFLDLKAAISVVSGPKFNSYEILCISLLSAKYCKKDRIKNIEKRWRHHFPHYKPFVRAFCCHGNQSFDPICPKTLCSLSPTPMILHIKFDQDLPTGFRDSQVQKSEIFVTQGQVTPK